ncbi:EAL domain-containing protein [Lysobacter sp. A6]|uniref:EAL domain-containing protein n=2 Tax=Noviluteimonas lactosilytica TaxID=2888523 RepID=A0ABS8JLL9_9GAMM|nr:EAL domain-containing protein [Lysobacter lactosilyticus]MCC8364389.1 EAL domain-containing protein [Lysobacter lactosilyticus]
MAVTAGGTMPATKTKRHAASKDPFAQFRGSVDGLAQQLRNRRAQGWDSGTFEQIAHEIERLQNVASQFDQRWSSLLAQMHGPVSAARVAQRMPDAGATAQMISTAEHLLLQLPTAGKPGDDSPQRGETPPPNYWRRWSEDAPPADAQDASSTHAAPPDATPPNPVPMPPLGGEEPPFRVLIVEDDRAQALFAAGVLNGAGIESIVAADPADVIDMMVRITPDLVLMDLHMPGLSGAELTTMIRAHESFLHTPIVFLTGDPDPDKQFEVLELGADDFLQKPIRPRHLIAAIESRVKRARALGKQRMTEASRHPATGLMARGHLLQQLGATLPASGGGVFFLEVEGTATLRERFGYAALERLMTETGRRLGDLAGTHPATRLNDHSFLVFTPGLDDDGLERQARVWREGISQHHFEVDGHTIRLRVTVGYAALKHGFTDAGGVLEAAETASRHARSQATSIAAYEPPDRTSGSDLSEYLRDALADDRFEIVYQPIVAVAGGDEAQYQTLLRMRGADGTLHNAAEIVPAAETSGIIHDIDRWVLERGLDVLQQRRAQGRPVRLFIPQSPRTLARDAYADWLASAIAVRGLEGPSLVIDVRLADALIHSVTLRQFCDHLVPVGVQFCVSQYEHSPDADSLLSQLPLGYIRLSARYAHADAGALRDAMRTSIDRAHRQGLQVIGHSVEDPQAAATLWMSGIDFIQGNLVQQAASELDFDFKNAVL